MSIVYGYDLKNGIDDPILRLATDAIDEAKKVYHLGALALNTFPVLLKIPRWFPGGGFHDYAEKYKKMTHEMRDRPFDNAMDEMKDGKAKASLVHDMTERYGEGFDGEALRGAAGTSLAGKPLPSSLGV